jgi:hypothetical protein
MLNNVYVSVRNRWADYKEEHPKFAENAASHLESMSFEDRVKMEKKIAETVWRIIVTDTLLH